MEIDSDSEFDSDIEGTEEDSDTDSTENDEDQNNFIRYD